MRNNKSIIKIIFQLIALLIFPLAISAADPETEIQNKINQMTLDEKEKMCFGNGSMDGGSCARLGIGPLRMCDGPLGAKRRTGYEYYT